MIRKTIHKKTEIEKIVDEDEKGSSTLQDEVQRPIKEMRRRKATVKDDNIPVDLLNKLAEIGVRKLIQFINRIYKTRVVSNDFLNLTMIPLKRSS